MSARTQEAIDTVWEFLSFILTAIVFLLVGLAITPGSMLDAALPIADGIAGRAGRTRDRDLRAARRGGPRGAENEQGLPRGWLHVLFWSGLRGAVAVALALSLPDSIPQRSLLQAITFGIVLFTLIVQGGTIRWVVSRALGPDPAGSDLIRRAN